MTKKQHQNRVKNIKNIAEKSRARAAEQKQMEAEAEALEKDGKWDEAAVAWAAVADYATGKAKARAAGHQAAAKTRASAAHKAIEEQMDAQTEAGETAQVSHLEIERADREQRALEEKALEEKQSTDETRACTPEEMAAEAAAQEKEQQEKEPKAKKEKAPRERDPRLPPAGTVIVKTDRNGTERVRCVIAEGGIEYGGATYKTISAAAMAAARDLGLASKSQDGYAFWGLKKPAPKPVSEEALAEARATYTDAANRYGALAEQYPDPLPMGDEINADTAAQIEKLIIELRAIATGLSAAKKLVK